ncbi:MAG TPA: hypothetical protein VIM67_11205 [Terriglobus sp.]
MSNWYVLFFLLMLVRVPYYATHHVQEDAYITFRSAFHLADHGQFSYNLGTHTPGVTSMLYGPIVALLRVLFRGYAIIAVQIFGTAMQTLGALLLAKSLFTDTKRQKILFVLAGLLPISLMLSYTGMETPILTMVVCWSMYMVRTGTPTWWCLLPIYLLPMVRPDSVSYGLLLACLIFSMSRIKGIAAAVVTGAGALTVLIFNKIVSGEYITNTMRAKEIIYSPSHKIGIILERTWLTFVRGSFGALIWTPMFARVGIVTILLAILCAVVIVRRQRGAPVQRLFLFMIAAGLIIPFCYDVGGVLFPWYLWVPSWLLLCICCYPLAEYLATPGLRWRRHAIALTCICLLVLDAGQWVFSFSKGLEEYRYRAGVGLDLKSIAHPGDTLFLESAGYIPFFSELYTDDNVGLGSRRMLDYAAKYGYYYMYHFVQECKPTFIVNVPGKPRWDRDAVMQQWLASHYHIAKHYHYDPANYVHSPLLLRLLKDTTVFDYDVWETNDRT